MNYRFTESLIQRASAATLALPPVQTTTPHEHQALADFVDKADFGCQKANVTQLIKLMGYDLPPPTTRRPQAVPLTLVSNLRTEGRRRYYLTLWPTTTIDSKFLFIQLHPHSSSIIEARTTESDELVRDVDLVRSLLSSAVIPYHEAIQPLLIANFVMPEEAS